MTLSHRIARDAALLFALLLACAVEPLTAQLSAKSAYDQINAFALGGGKADVSNLVLKRDRVSMTLLERSILQRLSAELSPALYLSATVHSMPKRRLSALKN